MEDSEDQENLQEQGKGGDAERHDAATASSSRCCNCSRKFGRDCLSTRQFYYEFYEEGELVKKHVFISDAVKEICQWRLFGFSGKAVDDTFCGNSHARVCAHECGIAIAKLYGAIKVFDSLAHTTSTLHLLTKNLLKAFIEDANQCGTSGTPADRRKHPPNLLTKTITSAQEVKEIGSRILNRPVTQYLSLEKKKPEAESDSVIRILGPADLQGQEFYSAEELNTPDPLETHDDYVEECEEFQNDESDDGTNAYPQSFRENKPFVVKPYLCQLCGAGLSSRHTLRTHELLTHKIGPQTEKVYQCEYCGKEFFFQYLLRNHEVCHIDERNFQCPSCELKFKSKQRLAQHQRDVHGEAERKFACTMCPKQFKHQRTLWEHRVSFHGNKGSKITFVCKYGCGSTTSRSRSLLAHHRKCRKRPEAQGQLAAAVESIVSDLPGDGELTEKHLEKVDDGGKRMQIYACKWDCGKRFTDAGYRKKHQKNVCRKRPNQNPQPTPPTIRSKSRRIAAKIAKTPPAAPTLVVHKVSSEPMVEHILMEEPIEVETVFDEIITVIPS